MMFDENQLVQVKWSNKTRRWFESKGYLFTAYGDNFFVKAKDLSDGSGKKVKVICDYCGKEYEVVYCDYNNREDKTKDVCGRKCRALKQYENSKSKRAKYQFDKAREICDMYNYQLLTSEDEYTAVNMDVKFICKKHGLQTIPLYNLIHGHECYFCSYEKRGENSRHSIEYVQTIIESYNNNQLLNPEDYLGSNIHNLKIKCGSCGRVYETSFSDYVSNMQIRCKSCAQSESNGEMRIRVFLEKNNINFTQEKTFDDCVDKRRLPFDFYLPEYNLIIEFDGQHHFYETGRGNLEITKKHDEIKNQYCKTNGIDLLRIPYWHGNGLENILIKQLNL